MTICFFNYYNETTTLLTILLKLSKILEVRKLTIKINQIIKKHNNEVDFILLILQYETSNQNDNDKILNEELEQFLSNRINECLSNEKFKNLPIHIHSISSKPKNFSDFCGFGLKKSGFPNPKFCIGFLGFIDFYQIVISIKQKPNLILIISHSTYI